MVLPQRRPGTDDAEDGAIRANEVARRRAELARLDVRDRLRELGPEAGEIGALERRRHKHIRPLQELVDDLDLVRTRPQARDRVDEPLDPVLAFDYLLRRPLAEHVRLVVD